MNQIGVVTGGVALVLVAWELWFFLRPPQRTSSRKQAPVQEFHVTVQRGFKPDLLFVDAGKPVRLHFHRRETDPRTKRLEFDTLNISKTLSDFETTSVDFIPAEPGDYCFRCGVICEGQVVAQIGGEAARGNVGRGHQKHG